MTILVGDSIGLSMADDLAGVVVDAEVGRQFDVGLAVVQELSDAGELHRRMVIELGTNGYIREADLDKMIGLLATKRRRVWFVNNYVPFRPWEVPNNQMLREAVESNSRLSLIRWKKVATAHPEWFTSDPMGIHPDADGQAHLAAMITVATAV